MPQNSSFKQSEARARRFIDLTGAGSNWRAAARKVIRLPMAVAIVFCVGAYLIVVSGRDRLPYYLGETLAEPVHARVAFERVNQLRTAELRRKAEQEVPSYFRLNKPLLDNIEAEFRNLSAAVKGADAFEKFKAAPDAQRWAIDEAAFNALARFTDDAGSAKFKSDCAAVLERLARSNMILRSNVERETRGTAGVVMLDRGDGGDDHDAAFESISIERLTYAVNAEHVERLADRAARNMPVPEIRPIIKQIVAHAITKGPEDLQPIYVFDTEYTRAQIEKAGRLEPVKDSYKAGDLLVQPGIIDGESLALLSTEHDAFLAARQRDPVLIARRREELSGLFGIVLLVTAGLAIFTHYVQQRVTKRALRALGLAALLLFMLATDRVLLVGLGASPMWSVASITVAAAILAVAYTRFFSIGIVSGLAILTVLALEAGFEMFLVHLAVITVTALQLREIRTRLKMVEVGMLTAVVAALAAALVGLLQEEYIGAIAKGSAIAALAAFAGISATLVLLPLIENAFKITTSLTLLEWADTSNALLRHLIEKAPGTWQHSHLLGSMAESCAEEIGANGLLVRVGAYYHDIGKTFKPTYFVENQHGKESAHKNLAPTMSLLVILAHVKDGLAMAREHRLPRVLQNFIAEHHGTTVVRYFHARAAQEARAGRDVREVSESEFRYPGPKPQSRETAILMLCDGVEGAVRALQDPTPSRIETVVHEIAMARLLDGQFDDCDITLKELARVEESLVKSLRALHHGRITYPKAGESEGPNDVRRLPGDRSEMPRSQARSA